MRAVVQLTRHSGLAIGDAVTLKRDSLVFDKKKNVYRVVTSRQKTGTHLSVLIPADVAKELLSVANGNAEYVFGVQISSRNRPSCSKYFPSRARPSGNSWLEQLFAQPIGD